VSAFDPLCLTFLFFCILDCFTRVFRGLLLVLKDTFLLLLVLILLFFVYQRLPQDYTRSIPSPAPKLSTGYPQVYPQDPGKLGTILAYLSILWITLGYLWITQVRLWITQGCLWKTCGREELKDPLGTLSQTPLNRYSR